MSDGNLARYLAPAALVVAALAILIIWQSSVESDAPSEPTNQARPAETAQDAEGGDGGDAGGESGGGGDPQAGDGPQAGNDPQAGDEAAEGEGETYTVQSGDTLSTIAAQTGVDVQTLLELNEDVNPQALQAGDELQLSP